MVLDLQPDSLLFVGDVARAFGVSTEAVALRKIGGVHLFRDDAVLEFHQERATLGARDAAR